MINLELLKEHHGLTDENLRKWLDGDPLARVPTRGLQPMSLPPETDDKTRGEEMTKRDRRLSLLNRIRSRIQEGQTRNLSEWKLWYALDQAWETCFRQITPTMVSTFMDADPNNEEVYKQIQSWGLTHLITESQDIKSGKAVKQFNLPVFFNILVPLVKAYVTIRWAKIMNDRRLTPFFKFEPVKLTAEISLKCDVVTDRISIMSNQYGYFDVTKQAVLKMLHYSECLQFPETEWDSEEHERYATADDVLMGKKVMRDGKEDIVKPGDIIRVTVREGIKYHHPHPSRTFRDLAHPAYTFNYGYGARYAGYWRIIRYREVLEGNFWNKDKIALGNVDMINSNTLFFQTVYSACRLSIPVYKPPAPDGSAGVAQLGLTAGENDRERQIANLYYGTEHGDQGVLVTEYFEKLVPKDNGLGTYDCPLWFRFCVAGDGCTVLYAAPLPYDPIIYYGYDADESRARNASMSLEVLPFQDHFSNVLTQIVLTAKQNLANMTLLDESQLTEEAKKKVVNLGEGYYRFLNVFGYDSKKNYRGQNRVEDVAKSVNFPKGNVAELINVLKTILDILERVLVMSSQEVGQAASHEQTREEIKNIQSNTSSRLVFTSTPVDIARDAWKRQLYCGLMAYGDDDIYAQIPAETPLTKDQLSAMGFTFIDKDVPMTGGTGTNGYEVPKVRYKRVKTTKAATAIPLWEIANTRDGDDRMDKVQIASAMAAMLDKLLNNPVTAAAIGADQAIEFTNYLSQMAGLPRDAKFRNATPEASPSDQEAAAKQELQQIVQAVMEQVQNGLAEDLKPLVEMTRKTADQTVKNSQDLNLVMQKVVEIMNAAGMATPVPNESNNGNTETAQPRVG